MGLQVTTRFVVTVIGFPCHDPVPCSFDVKVIEYWVHDVVGA